MLTHGNLSSMVNNMHTSWGWSARDVILSVLPLHHVHGLVNVVLTSLASGAVCVMEPKFDAQEVTKFLLFIFRLPRLQCLCSLRS